MAEKSTRDQAYEALMQEIVERAPRAAATSEVKMLADAFAAVAAAGVDGTLQVY